MMVAMELCRCQCSIVEERPGKFVRKFLSRTCWSVGRLERKGQAACAKATTLASLVVWLMHRK